MRLSKWKRSKKICCFIKKIKYKAKLLDTDTIFLV